MSYQVLARKWRPQSFEALVGQSHVLKALSNALNQGRLHHAYLLTGTRGVGKTTIARILARCFNCDKGVSASPCGVCASCLEINEGRSVDLIEVDAASRTKVEDTRELLDNVQYAPTQSRYKIYLIDEVHMLSNHSFNALLKTLEEPPPHVVFLFATTHPQKIPPTVLSRCLQFHLKNLTADLIVEHLKVVFDAESVDYDDEGLWAIARAGQGSMRDSLSLSDQAIAFGGGNVTGQGVNDMLGTIDQEVLTQLLAAVVINDAAQALTIIAEYAQKSPDFLGLVDELLKLVHRIVVEQAVPSAGSEGQLNRQFIQQYATLITPENLQLYYQSLLIGKRDLPMAPDPLTGMEMIIMRLFAFQLAPLDRTDQADIVRAESVAVVDSQKKKPITENVEAKRSSELQVDDSISADAPMQSPVDELKTQIESKGISSGDSSVQSQGSKPLNIELASTPLEQANSDADGIPLPSVDVSDTSTGSTKTPDIEALTPAVWCQIFSAIPLSGVVRTVASYCVPINFLTAGDQLKVCIEFALDESNATLFNPDHNERLAEGLSIYFSRPVDVTISLVGDWSSLNLDEADEAPAEYRTRMRSEAQGEALDSLKKDQNVETIMAAFDAEMDIDSVKPL
ncbi:MAG: hypothetical protein CBD32_02895 [Actinobacteria bacterium TMED172]|nr:DNA polymerase III subunit gamma/tau [Cellvibrionales bacterium]OUW33501.1 MAG: hypothetical protein CBD32_02895 [Actinobacteria bacterium TMED172]